MTPRPRNVLTAAAPDACYLARHVALRCKLPVPTPALIGEVLVTFKYDLPPVNRLCGSGFQSIVNGVQEILAGDSSVVLTGGTDNMSACPYAVRDIRSGEAVASLSHPLLLFLLLSCPPIRAPASTPALQVWHTSWLRPQARGHDVDFSD